TPPRCACHREPMVSRVRRITRNTRLTGPPPAAPRSATLRVPCLSSARDVASSHALDDLLAEEALGTEEEEDEGDDVGEPVFDGAADEGAPVDLAEFLAHAHDEAADDGARHRREAAQDQHRQGLEGDQREAERHAAL